MTVNEDLFNRGIRHAMLLEGLKDAEVARIAKFLGGDFRKDILARYMSAPIGQASGLRYESLLDDIKRMSRGAMRTIEKDVVQTLNEVGGLSVSFAGDSLSEALPFAYNPSMPGPNMIRALVANEPVQGKLVTTWFKDLGQTMGSRVNQQITLGLTQGESVDQIIRRIRGTRAGRYMDGVIGATRRDVEAVVRTQMTHVSNKARERVYEANGEVIKGVQYVATLDARTTDICAGLDGRVFKPTEGPRPPLHIRCRSTTVPVTKSFKELGEEFKSEKLKGLPESRVNRVRASMDGVQRQRNTYEKWLRGQPREFQDAVLGSKRAELFRDKRVHFTRFTNYGVFPPKELTAEELLQLEKSLGNKATKINEQLKKFSASRTPKPPIKAPKKPAAPAEKELHLLSGEELRARFMQENAVELGQMRSKLDMIGTFQAKKTSIIAANRKLSAEQLGEVRRLTFQIRDMQQDVAFAQKGLRARLHKMLEQPEARRFKGVRDQRPMAKTRGAKLTKAKTERTDELMDEGLEWVTKHFANDAIRFTNEDFVNRFLVQQAKNYADDLAFQNMTANKVGGRIVFQRRLLKDGGRAYQHVYEGIAINPETNIRTVIHELMHSIEAFDSSQMRSSAAFLKRRGRAAAEKSTNLSRVRKLKDIENPNYTGTEMAFRDDFEHTYTGKIYKNMGKMDASEVLSMGVEEIYANPIGMMMRDPDFFDHIVDRMRGISGRNYRVGPQGFTDDVLDYSDNNFWYRSGGIVE